MSENSKTFVEGLFIREPSASAPEFVKLKLSFSVSRFSKWIEENQDEKGWVSIDILKSRKGDLYAAKNEYKPSEKPESLIDRAVRASEEVDDDIASSIPF